ncbi:MAG: serine/threonine protein kinase [Planctomycetes bacterium]|nr:serine/threonine protein kinase [Planctomycetota bacterium]
MDTPTPGSAPSDDVTRRGSPAAGARPALEDLSTEWTLRGVRTVEYEGAPRPLLGRYVALSKIASGGMGTVFHARHRELGTDVALKVLHPSVLEGHPGALERFLREARLAANLRSEHLVSVLDVAQEEASGSHYLVMEYVRGGSARQWADECIVAGAPPAEHDVLDLVIATTKGLAAAHAQGVVHRDVKPANILVPLGADGRSLPSHAKLSDLGLARIEDGGHTITATGLGLGTPGYMAPEQARGAIDVGRPADVFAVGATLYALLAGVAPFSGTTPYEAITATVACRYRPIREVRADVSEATAALIARCLARDPADRFADAQSLLAALGDVRAVAGDVAAAAIVAARIAPVAERDTLAAPLGAGDVTPWLGAPGAAPSSDGGRSPPVPLPHGTVTLSRRTLVLVGVMALIAVAVVVAAARMRDKRSGPAAPPAVPAALPASVPTVISATSAFRIGRTSMAAPLQASVPLRDEDVIRTADGTVTVSAEDDVLTIDRGSVVLTSRPADGAGELRLVSGSITAKLTGDIDVGTPFQRVALAVGGEANVRLTGDLEFGLAGARDLARRLQVECLSGAIRLDPRENAALPEAPAMRRAMALVGAGLSAGASITFIYPFDAAARREGAGTVQFVAGDGNTVAVSITIGRRHGNGGNGSGNGAGLGGGNVLEIEVPRGARGEVTVPGIDGGSPKIRHDAASTSTDAIVVFSVTTGPGGREVRRELRHLGPGDEWVRP